MFFSNISKNWNCYSVSPLRVSNSVLSGRDKGFMFVYPVTRVRFGNELKGVIPAHIRFSETCIFVP